MKTHASAIILAFFLLLALLLIPGAAGATPPAVQEPESLILRADTLVVAARRSPVEAYRARLLFPTRPVHATFTADPMLISVDLLPRPEPVPLTRFQCSMAAAGTGANAALFLGKIGDWLGFWEEETAFAIMGAGAAAGAILGAASER